VPPPHAGTRPPYVSICIAIPMRLMRLWVLAQRSLPRRQGLSAWNRHPRNGHQAS